jgi:putative ABC transport system substrate-binding protein
MQRRQFITLLGGAAVAWPFGARAQQGSRIRRIGVLIPGADSDPALRNQIATLRHTLQTLGWIEGGNLRIDPRFVGVDLSRTRAYAQELVSLAPDVIVVGGAAGTRVLQGLTRTIPIVFVSVGDPISSKVVASIARPEGNTTGLTNLFPSIAGKWLELLTEAAPHVAQVALVFNPEFPVVEDYLASIETAAATLAVKAVRTPVRSANDIERAINVFAGEPNGGLIQVPPPLLDTDRKLILRLAEQHRLPMIVYDKLRVAEGGLMSYGPDTSDLYRSAATYVDRLLRGMKVSDLPVQFPTKFELVVNLKTAKAIGLTIPEAFLLRADEVIE